MKFYQILALAATAALATACDEYTLPNPPAQSNPAEPVFNNADLKVTNLVDGTINLPELQSEGLPVEIFSVSSPELPEGYTLQFQVEMSANSEFTPSKTINCTPGENGIVSMPVTEMQMAFNELVSKDLVAKDLYVRIPAYAVNGTSEVRIGGPDVYYYNGIYNVLPLPQENVIETGYYLVGNFCDWDIRKGIRFEQVNAGNPYDNPEFTVKIDVSADLADSADGYQWKVVPVSGYDNNTWADAFGAVTGDSSTSGNLLPAPEAQNMPGEIRQEGPYTISINMETRKYEVAPAYEYLWVPGMGSSTTNFDKIMRLTTSNYINYTGTMRLASRFWFTGQASTKGVSFRPDGDDNEVDANGVLSGKMIYDVTSTAMMRVPTTGLYLVQANVITLTWSATPIPVISAIGEFNDWNTETAPNLTPDSRFEVWTLKDQDLPAGEFKFCVNHAWDISYGGAFDNVVENGGNFTVTEAGKYDIELYFNVFPNCVKLIKK